MPSLIHKRFDGTERTLQFSGKPLIVGRLNESDIPVPDAFVSRVHCGITFTNNLFNLKDLGSTNGTYRNGARVFECTLNTGDKIQVGNASLVFELDSSSGNATLSQVSPAGPASAPAPPHPDVRELALPVKVPGPPPPPSALAGQGSA